MINNEIRSTGLDYSSARPPGKPIIACRKVQVAVELASGEVREVLRDKGLAAMRQQRLARQAQVQGGLLTVEDLAYLTCSSTATVKRDLAACRGDGVAVPTRGQIRDIGPGVSHKAQVVQYYLWGFAVHYDKGEVVVAAIVEDICTVVRNYFRRPDDLEPGQLIYCARRPISTSTRAR